MLEHDKGDLTIQRKIKQGDKKRNEEISHGDSLE